MVGLKNFKKGWLGLFLVIQIPFFSTDIFGYIGNTGIVINEVQPEGDGTASNPDWVELYNKATQPVDIADWILNNRNIDRKDNTLIIRKNGRSYSDTTMECKNEGGRDCLYRIPYDPDTLNDSDSSNDYTLYVDPGCFVVIYNTSGTNDYSCSGDNVITLYMGYDNKDKINQDGDDIEIIPYFYYQAYDDSGNETEAGFIWLVEDYFAWEVDSSNSNLNRHPNHCGLLKDGVFDQYPTFMFHYESNSDIDEQCKRKSKYYIKNGYSVPFSFPVDYSSKKMDPSTLQLHSTYSRTGNGYDSDSPDNFAVATDTPGTTDLKLSGITAKRIGDKILVSWRSSWENGVIGFNVYGSIDGKKYEKLNNTIIFTKGDMSSYSFVTDLTDIKFIKLQILETGDHQYFLYYIKVKTDDEDWLEYEENNGDTQLISSVDSVSSDSAGCSSTGGIDFGMLVILIPLFFRYLVFKYKNTIG